MRLEVVVKGNFIIIFSVLFLQKSRIKFEKILTAVKSE